ncbi:MAG: 5-(carboxyamino)imidazole ribonucleotide synthase [Pseudomonadota bacterium]
MHIAIAGCGQLSRMLALAGIPLGFKFSFIADEPGLDTDCVEQLGSIVQWDSDQSPIELFALLGNPNVVSAEKEQIDVALLESLAPFCDVYPSPSSFAILQDRHKEKQLLSTLSIPSSPFCFAQAACEAIGELGLPAVAKSCRGGYDGKNQHVIKSEQDAIAFDALGEQDHYIIEQWVPFEREVSIVSVRDQTGHILHYPVTENVHEQGILKHSIAPARDLSEPVVQSARDYITRVMDAIDYVGVMAIECFVIEDRLLVNEIAPRVHNSGHWTQYGSKTSQFENHLRAIAGLPLGSTEHHRISGMVNLIGSGVPAATALSADSSLHWYNKTARPGRKLGHVNFGGASHEELIQRMERFRRDAMGTGT